MIIVSQDKDEIVNFENITSIVVNDVWEDRPGQVLTATDARGSRHSLGYYKNEERAKEVLKEIVNRYADVSMSNIIENLGITIHDRDFGGNASSVYEMPKE